MPMTSLRKTSQVRVPKSSATVGAPAPVGGRPSAVDEAKIASALEQFRAGNAKKAWSLCWQVLCQLNPALDPKKPGKAGQARSYHLLAQRFVGEKDYQNAQVAAGRAVALDPNLTESHALLGVILPRLDDLEGGLAAAERAVSLNAGYLRGHDVLVDVLLEMGRPRAALDHARQTAAAFPASPDAQVLLAKTLRRTGRDEEVLEVLARIAALSGGKVAPKLACAMGHALNDLGRHEEALEKYALAIAQSPHAIEAWQGRVNTLMTMGRTAEAHRAYKNAADTVPGYQKVAFDFLHPLDGLDVPVPKGKLDPSRVVLANAISTFPGLPLGPALIKAHVEHNSDFRVTCMDLNTDWYAAIIESQRNGGAAFHFEDRDLLVETADLFNHGGEAFFDNAQYGPRAELFARYRSLISDAYNTHCQAVYESDGPVPWYIFALARRILAHAPFVVGLSVMFTHEFWSAALLARALKILRPDVVTVFGGGFFNEANLESFVARPYVDYVILHDGEQPFLDFLKTLRSGGDFRAVSSLVRHDPESERVIENARNTKIDYNQIPHADFSDYDMGAYFMPSPVIPLISSRGCYWRRCTFCDHFASYAGSYKTQSITRCVDEIEHHVKTTGAKHFTFVDEMISAKRFQKIGEEILARGLDVRYFALAKPTADFTEEILDIMYKSGCRCIYWGLESASARILELMDKGNTVESSSRTLKLAAKVGIRNHLFMIVGFPSETREELWESIEFVYEHQDVIDKILAGPYVMKRGTPIYDHPERFGIGKIYVDRSLCNSKLLRYETNRGIPTDLTGPMAEYLLLNVFDPISGRHSYFGTPRNHIIIFYGADDVPPPTPRPLPSREEVRAALDAMTPQSRFAAQSRMVPIWEPSASSAP